MELTKLDKPRALSAAGAQSTSVPATTGSSLLLNLPPEMRNMIYKVILDSVDDSDDESTTEEDCIPGALLNLAHTCKLLRQECLPIYEANVEHWVEITRLYMWLRNIFEKARTASLPVTRNLVIRNDLFRKRGYFVIDVTSAAIYLAGLVDVTTTIRRPGYAIQDATITYDEKLEELAEFVNAMAKNPLLVAFLESHAQVDITFEDEGGYVDEIAILVNEDAAESWMYTKEKLRLNRWGLHIREHLWMKKMGLLDCRSVRVFIAP